MRFLRVCAIGLSTAVVGTFLAIFASEYLTRLYHVSNMEGQRGYAIIFLFAPAGFIVGFLIGATAALRTHWFGFVGFIKTQGLSILLTCVLVGIVSGLFYLAADKPPTIDGKQLVLDFELRLPSTIQLPAKPTDANMHASLYANSNYSYTAEIDLKSITRREGSAIVPGTVMLVSRSANRELLASIENEPGAAQFIDLKNLPAAPRKENETWSDWTLATQRADLIPVPEAERMAIRYRVRPVDD